MPRYHFNVYDGHSEMDRIGTEFVNVVEARIQALELAGGLIRESARQADFGEDWRIEVTDSDGMLLFRMDLIVVDAPAVSKAALSEMPTSYPDLVRGEAVGIGHATLGHAPQAGPYSLPIAFTVGGRRQRPCVGHGGCPAITIQLLRVQPPSAIT